MKAVAASLELIARAALFMTVVSLSVKHMFKPHNAARTVSSKQPE